MSVSPVGNLQSSRTFSLSKTSMVWAPIVKPEKMRTKRILERVHYTFKCSGRGKSFEEERCQMLPRHRYLHIPPPPPRKHEFLFFCKLGVLLFTTPTECVHLIFARLQLGIFLLHYWPHICFSFLPRFYDFMPALKDVYLHT